MGKKIIPPNDPERLQRILDERSRMIGIEKRELDKQAQEKRAREERDIQEIKAADDRLLHWSEHVLKIQEDVEAARKTASRRLADTLQHQVQDKKNRDAYTREQYKNRVSESYHQQFGTSHR